MSMRIYGFTQYGGPEVAEVLEVDEPVPDAGQVLIRTTAAGVNPADIKVRSGLRQDSVTVRFPMAMGREAAGTVLAVGPGVDGLLPGDEVFGSCAPGHGALAELVLLDAAGTAKRPCEVSAEQAATVPVALGTALDIVTQVRLAAGQSIVVLGAGGGVGMAVCQLATHVGATVVGVASPGKAEIVSDTGARHVPSGQGWQARVRTELGGRLVDVAVDLVGGDHVDLLADLVADASRLVSPAAPARATQLGGGGAVRRRTTQVFREAAELVADGVLRPRLRIVRGLEHAAAAVALVEDGHAEGKVVLRLGSPHADG